MSLFHKAPAEQSAGSAKPAAGSRAGRGGLVSAGAAALARKLGAMTEGRNIKVDEEMATNVPGLYAAGDCTGGLLQISKAVGEGAKAAMSMIRFVRQQKK